MFRLESSAFANGETIPEKYAEKNRISPPLSWEDVPLKTKSFALAMTDPDVPEIFGFPRVFVHWLIYNIPVSTTVLLEGASPSGKLPPGAEELNSDLPGYGTGYGGPWPPDAAHRYVFTLYALKVEKLALSPHSDYIDFVKVVLPQTIATATLIGHYGPAKSPLPSG
jgi:Raf kinase inhibitor-like YbhB/YbcL family protein